MTFTNRQSMEKKEKKLQKRLSQLQQLRDDAEVRDKAKMRRLEDQIKQLTLHAQQLEMRLSRVAEYNAAWTPFVEATAESIDSLNSISVDKFSMIYLNSRYQVNVRVVDTKKERDGQPVELDNDFGPISHLSIKRLDKGSYISYRDKQRIKKELCGPNTEAIELFPAAVREVDTANQYHLFVLPAGQFWPVGWMTRIVSETSDVPNTRQDPWEEGDRPSDLQHIAGIPQMKQMAESGKTKN